MLDRKGAKMETGIKGYQELIVTEDITASAMGSGSIEVYGTPAMILLIEETAKKSVVTFLEEGDGTVGTELNIKHLSATPVGMKVWCETELIEVDGRRLLFNAVVYDECGKIGEGTHERFIVNNKKFHEKTYSKLEK